MTSTWSLEVTLLPGSEQLLADHAARAAPTRRPVRRVLRRARASRGGARTGASGAIDQDSVALAAGSVVLGGARPGHAAPRRNRPPRLPAGAALGRRPRSCRGRPRRAWCRRSSSLSERRLAAIPFAGPCRTDTLDGCSISPRRWRVPATLVANFATRHLWGARASVAELWTTCTTATRGAGAGLGRRATSRAWSVACAGPGGSCTRSPTPIPALGDARRAHAAARASGGGARAARHADRRRDRGRPLPRTTRTRCGGARTARPAAQAIWDNGTVTREPVSDDGPRLAGLLRPRLRSCAGARWPRTSSPSTLTRGVGWVPAEPRAHAARAAGRSRTRSGRSAICGCCPTPSTHVRVEPAGSRGRSSCCCATSSETDGHAVGVLPARSSARHARRSSSPSSARACGRASSTSSSC